jgi:hypothetical protein
MSIHIAELQESVFSKHPVVGTIITIGSMTLGLVSRYIPTLLVIDVPVEIIHWFQVVAYFVTISVGILTGYGLIKKHFKIK